MDLNQRGDRKELGKVGGLETIMIIYYLKISLFLINEKG